MKGIVCNSNALNVPLINGINNVPLVNATIDNGTTNVAHSSATNNVPLINGIIHSAIIISANIYYATGDVNIINRMAQGVAVVYH